MLAHGKLCSIPPPPEWACLCNYVAFGDRDRGIKTYRTQRGGGLAPKVAPRRLGLLTPNWRQVNPPWDQALGPDIFWWVGDLPSEGVGAKQYGMSFETHGNQTFERDIPGSLPGCPGGARKV